VALCDVDDYILLFITGFSIAVCLRGLLEGIDPANHRLEMICLDQFFEPHEHICFQRGRAIIHGDKFPVSRQRLAASDFLAVALAYRVENQVLTFQTAGEILPGVINDSIRAQ
jgi:hypothetical protein